MWRLGRVLRYLPGPGSQTTSQRWVRLFTVRQYPERFFDNGLEVQAFQVNLNGWTSRVPSNGFPMSRAVVSTMNDGLRATGSSAADVDHEESLDHVAAVKESLVSYDAIGVYLSFVFHLLALAITLLVLWLLNLLYMPRDYDIVDPIRASLADEIVLDDEPVMEHAPLELAESTESPEEASVSAATTINEEILDVGAVLNDVTNGTDGLEGETGLNVFLPKGGNAVTKGSFTAWTSVQNPKPNDPYSIVIEIKLPKKIKGYRLRDLSGKVVGSDDYFQRIPFDRAKGRLPAVRAGNSRAYRVKTPNDRIAVRGGKIQIIIDVPGAKRDVHDVITIQSDLLREEQTMELTFGRSGRRPTIKLDDLSGSGG